LDEEAERERILPKIGSDGGNRCLGSLESISGGLVVVEKLGQGGNGAVYLVRENGTHQCFALKIMRPRPGVVVTNTDMERFEREVTVTSQLRHQNIVEILWSGHVESLPYFVMQYYAAGSVRSLMKRRGGKLPLTEAGGILLQVLIGLEYAHAQPVQVVQDDGSPRTAIGIVHRDLKPSNVLLSGCAPEWMAVVSDFGLAKAYDIAGFSGVTDSRTFGGTFRFTPREQAFDFKRVKPVSDVWSAAATLYNMVTGAFPRDPREGLTPHEVVVRCPVVPIRFRDSNIPACVASVVDCALADRISERIPTAREFRMELERVL
jgi:serine/threonine protein kinase